MPTDVLALGRHLVAELGLEERGDTLSRWMAHHVAELIDEARVGAPGRKRVAAEKQATETILRIWEHRENLPHGAYPLAPFKDLMKFLDLLQPNNNPYRFSQLSTTDRLAALLFDRLSRLIILLLLLRLEEPSKPSQASRAAVKAMNDEEQGILKSLNAWVGVLLLARNDGKTKTARKNTKRSPKLEAKARRDFIIQLIDESANMLTDLRKEIAQAVAK